MRPPQFLVSLSILAVLLLPVTLSHAADTVPRHVILVTTDGFRWQEVFRGADDALMNKEDGGVADPATLVRKYGGASPEERREKLLPFLWGTVARQGQLYGHRERGSLADVTNTRWFSYPGYNELLTGRADDAGITSNRPVPNPNVNVLEWLQGRPGFAGKVFACTAWTAFREILNVERSHLSVWSAGADNLPTDISPRLNALARLATDITSPWQDEHYDAFVQQAALETIDARQPRVLYLSFGETDEWAHARRYDNYLEAAHRVDRWIGELWQKLQSLPEYRGNTTLLFTTDHGRGATPKDWINHNDKTPDSGQIWLAAMGPDVPPLGERTDSPAITQAQVAATVARCVGEDYPAAVPVAAPEISSLFVPPHPSRD